MKQALLVLIVFITLWSCSKKELRACEAEVFKGKLVRKGICMNYVIQIVDGALDPSLYEAEWIHPTDRQTYTNVFALESVCTFPNTIEEGDAFFFTLKNETENCAVCLAYSPTPDKKIAIKVCD